jgi:hypothetical protein
MIYMLSHDDRHYFSLHCRLPLRHPRLLPAGIIRILTVVSYILPLVSYILPLVVCVMPIVFWSAALFLVCCSLSGLLLSFSGYADLAPPSYG